MKLEISPLAAAQIDAIIDFIGDDSQSAAHRWFSGLDRLLLRIQQFPAAGHPVREFPKLPLLEVRYGSYRVIYDHGKSVIHLHGVIHGARNLQLRLLGLDGEE